MRDLLTAPVSAEGPADRWTKEAGVTDLLTAPVFAEGPADRPTKDAA
ncbi:hypothetical protein OHT76_18745 [Streptomyces sp. NBC_00287]|nr:hypothetical protein [Streptomyces sp. NBC_00287]